VLSPGFLALALVLFLVLLLPVDRLRRAGWSPRALGAYLLAMLLLGLVLAELPGPTRFLVPILVIGYLAPFVVARVGLDRVRPASHPGVTVERPPIKQVSGPARDVPRPGPRPNGAADEEPAGVQDDSNRSDRGDGAEAGRTSRSE